MIGAGTGATADRRPCGCAADRGSGHLERTSRRRRRSPRSLDRPGLASGRRRYSACGGRATSSRGHDVVRTARPWRVAQARDACRPRRAYLPTMAEADVRVKRPPSSRIRARAPSRRPATSSTGCAGVLSRRHRRPLRPRSGDVEGATRRRDNAVQSVGTAIETWLARCWSIVGSESPPLRRVDSPNSRRGSACATSPRTDGP